jgi:hypothetical protein
MRYIKEYKIDSLGVEWPDYFQGYGSEDFDRAVTGIGSNAAEAYDDALEQIAQEGTEVDDMPKRPAGIRKSDKVSASKGEDSPYYYVGIRYNVTLDVDPSEDDGKQYKIVRYYAPLGTRIRKPQVIERCLTIGQARAHCTNPKTSTESYFDGYMRQ